MQGGGVQHWANTDDYSVITVMAALVSLDSILHSALSVVYMCNYSDVVGWTVRCRNTTSFHI